MANQSSRGGMKQPKTVAGEKRKLSVRPGSAATKKQRGNKTARRKVVPNVDDR